jgi:GT2 family glycosyltransferase
LGTLTIVVTAWQHFGDTARALESIYAGTSTPFSLIYVDANSPPAVRSYLREQAAKRGFTLLQSERFLTSSEARNLALAHVRTNYVLFLDNGTIVMPGCVDALMQCADETDAWAVEPIYCMGDPNRPVIYSAAPDLGIIDDGKTRRLYETAPFKDTVLADVRATLLRKQCGYAKFHCALIRMDAIERLGGFDEGYTSFHDHRAYGLAIRQAGGTIYFEPAAVAILVDSPKLVWSDLPLFLLRWSDAWLRPSANHFAKVWNLNIDDHGVQGPTRFRNFERKKLFAPLRRMVQRVGGWRAVSVVDAGIDIIYERLLEPAVIARLERKRRAVA